MTNHGAPSALLCGLLALVLACAAPSQAHGAPAAREIDQRVLLDDDGGLGYGGCLLGEACSPQSLASGLDLLALDVREAFLDGQAALVFRILYQSEAPVSGGGLELQALNGAEVSTFHIASEDGLSFASPDLARLDGPFDVGDGHPKALDAWVPYQALGVAAGSVLDGITVTSTLDGEPDDVMPGTWYAQGQEVPHVPHDTDAAESVQPAPAGTYTLSGPAPLLRLTSGETVVDLAAGPVDLSIRVDNLVGSLAQFVQLRVESPAGRVAALEPTTLNLLQGGTREVLLTVENATADGNLTLVATSDLGAQATLGFIVKVPPAVTSTPTDAATGPAPAKGAPLPAWTGVVALTALALARRR